MATMKVGEVPNRTEARPNVRTLVVRDCEHDLGSAGVLGNVHQIELVRVAVCQLPLIVAGLYNVQVIRFPNKFYFSFRFRCSVPRRKDFENNNLGVLGEASRDGANLGGAALKGGRYPQEPPGMPARPSPRTRKSVIARKSWAR